MALPPTFSNRVRLQAGRVPDRQAAPNIIGQAATVLGRTIGQINDQNHEVDRQIAASEARIQEREAARDREVRKVELYDDFLAMQTERDRQRADLEEKYDSSTDMDAAVVKLHDDTDSAFLSKINDQELRGEFQQMLARDRAQARGRADLFVRKQRAERQAVATDGIANKLQNRVLALPATGSMADLDTALGELDGVLAGQIGDETRRAKVKQLYGAQFIDSYLDNRMLVGDYKGAIDAISSDKYAAIMDPGQAATAMAKIQQKMASAAAAQVSDFKATARTTLEDVNAGVAVDEKTLQTMAVQAEAAGEADLAHDLRNGVGVVKANTVYANAAPLEIAAARRAIEQSGKDWRSKPDVVAAYNRLGTLERQNRGRVQNDVLGLWSASGQKVAPLDISDPASIRARHRDAIAAQGRFGGPLQVMSADEVEPFKRQFEQGSAVDKAEIIENFMRAGNATGKAFMRQIAPAKPEYAWLTDIAGMRNGAAGRATMREALNGWEQLKADATAVQGENGTKMGQAFARLTGSAIPVDQASARQAILQVAKGLYGARAQQAGARDYDAKLWEASIRDAMGAAPDGTGGLGVTRNSAAMLLPRGMTQGDVDISMARASGPNIVAAAGGNMPLWGGTRLNVGQLLDMQMEWAGDGLYRFRNSSGKYVASSGNQSQPFTLDIRRLMLINRDSPAAPVAPAAPRAPALQGKGSAAANAALGGGSLLQMLGIGAPDKAAVKRDAAAVLGGKP